MDRQQVRRETLKKATITTKTTNRPFGFESTYKTILKISKRIQRESRSLDKKDCVGREEFVKSVYVALVWIHRHK
ncbi:hypothetical protein HZH66_009218 [Vespula vulgaris]|uniref:Uncharacterized protein n=1 Tax=Vespula vulgaris TaxID=7454 RepID=A0A834N1H2_VESVU|nr:hypothetical protein HZH66_009218 [Vespula vulgaris]